MFYVSGDRGCGADSGNAARRAAPQRQPRRGRSKQVGIVAASAPVGNRGRAACAHLWELDDPGDKTARALSADARLQKPKTPFRVKPEKRLYAQLVDRFAALDPFLDPFRLAAPAGPLLRCIIGITETHRHRSGFAAAPTRRQEILPWHADALGDCQDLFARLGHIRLLALLHFLLDLILQIAQIAE